jgi:hypothetical protein
VCLLHLLHLMLLSPHLLLQVHHLPLAVKQCSILLCDKSFQPLHLLLQSCQLLL